MVPLKQHNGKTYIVHRIPRREVTRNSWQVARVVTVLMPSDTHLQAAQWAVSTVTLTTHLSRGPVQHPNGHRLEYVDPPATFRLQMQGRESGISKSCRREEMMLSRNVSRVKPQSQPPVPTLWSKPWPVTKRTLSCFSLPRTLLRVYLAARQESSEWLSSQACWVQLNRCISPWLFIEQRPASSSNTLNSTTFSPASSFLLLVFIS